jgi:hypothetical protein
MTIKDIESFTFYVLLVGDPSFHLSPRVISDISRRRASHHYSQLNNIPKFD